MWSAPNPSAQSNRLAGTNYVPGVSEEAALQRIETLLDRYLENPIDELPSARDGLRAPAGAEERR